MLNALREYATFCRLVPNQRQNQKIETVKYLRSIPFYFALKLHTRWLCSEKTRPWRLEIEENEFFELTHLHTCFSAMYVSI